MRKEPKINVRPSNVRSIMRVTNGKKRMVTCECGSKEFDINSKEELSNPKCYKCGKELVSL